MRRLFLFAVLGIAGLAVARRAGAIVAPGGGGSLDLVESVVGVVDDAAYSVSGYRLMSESRWRDAMAAPKNAAFVAALTAAEARHGIPPLLLVRLAWQESRFDPDAHNAGSDASGIMQIVPRWHPEVDPWEPFAAIDYGARYLEQLYRQFGTWEFALKAYNWGPGNLSKLLAGAAGMSEPLETQNYSAQILADLAAAGQVIG